MNIRNKIPYNIIFANTSKTFEISSLNTKYTINTIPADIANSINFLAQYFKKDNTTVL